MRLSTCSLALAFASTVALAQSFTPVREQKNLSPEAIAKLHTLETLNTLPPGQWHFHAGDHPARRIHDPRRLVLAARQPALQGPAGRRLVPPRDHRSQDPQRLRHLRLPHPVPVSRRRQRPHARDHLLQRPPRGPGRRPRTDRPLRARTPRRQGPGRRQTPPHRRREDLLRRQPAHRGRSLRQPRPPQPRGRPHRGHRRRQHPSRPAHAPQRPPAQGRRSHRRH